MNKLFLALVFISRSHTAPFSVSMIDYLNARSSVDLSTAAAITQYLPARLKNLKKLILAEGINNAVETLKNDPDIDSYLFIIDNSEPYRLVAYSRHPELFNKTLSELHQIIEVDSKSNEYCVEKALKDIVAIAQQIKTYTGYRWKTSAKDKLQYFVAYSTSVTLNNSTYTIGATIPTTKTYTDIVIVHRVEQVLKRIKKEGIKHIALTINTNLISSYFFIQSNQYPYRFIVHREPWTGLDPKGATKLRDPNCNRPECDVVQSARILRQSLTLKQYSKKEGCFGVYPWINKVGEEPILKITYIKPFEFQKKQFFVGTGLAADISLKDARDLQNLVKNCVKYIKEVGLENTISAAKKSNKAERYLFIIETKRPYKFALHLDPVYDQHTTDEVQSHLQSLGSTETNITEIAENIIEASRKGLGYSASKFFVDTQNLQKGTTIKVFYSELFKYNEKEYVVSTGIPIERMFNEFDKENHKETKTSSEKQGE